MIRFIAALDNKNGIADEHGIPWQGLLPGDVSYFRRHTLNTDLLMGYGAYRELAKPLPNRRNYIATVRHKNLRPGFERIDNVRSFLARAHKDIWVGGGADIFANTIDLADELYLTRIDKDFNCTKFFPPFEQHFTCVNQSSDRTENGVTYHFEVWQRR